MFYWICYLVLLLLKDGSAATNQHFTTSGEMNLTSCPITYYGEKYHRAYVAFDADMFAVCFNGVYKPGIKNDCILMSGGTADRGGLEVLTKEIPTGSGLHKLLPNLSHAGKCVNVIPLKDSQHSQIEQVELGNFGTQAIFAIKTFSGYTNVDVETDSQVNGLTVSKQTFQRAETNEGVVTDVSGCRLWGVAYETNTTIRDPNICSTVTCDVSGVATAVSDCGPMESCTGDGSCILNSVCTVTGSTIINFVGRVNSVPDRCGYILMKSLSIPGLQVVGVFRERRRKDISFLDHVILQLDGEGVQISLEQAGRVKLNAIVLTLNEAVLVVHGVKLSKDQNGVTAEMSTSKHRVSVLFDGTTALIHLKGPPEGGKGLEGLCSNFSKTSSDHKTSKHSSTGCELQHEDATDNKINCTTITKWCDYLNQPPFTICHKHIDPEPFINTCKDTLCKYPAADGLKCQFLEAYVRACSHRSNVEVEDWRSKTRCSAVPKSSCLDNFCSPHEFCGEKNKGGAANCVCRALFASKYKSANTFGEPTVCADNSTSASLVNCLLEDRSIDYSALHLNDPTCKGQMNNLNHMVTFSFDSNSCGSVIMANGSLIVYKNTITTRNSSMLEHIHRHSPLHIDFSCSYSQPDIRTLAFKIKDSAVTQHISVGQWNYSLTMMAYTDAELTEIIQPNAEMKLDQTIWVELKTIGLNEEILCLVTDSIWATNEPSPSARLRYDLVMNGCPNPADQTVKVEGNGLGTSNVFSFDLFQFTSSSTAIYLHCKIELCVRQGNTCQPRCSHPARRRRSARPRDENPIFITMSWIY